MWGIHRFGTRDHCVHELDGRKPLLLHETQRLDRAQVMQVGTLHGVSFSGALEPDAGHAFVPAQSVSSVRFNPSMGLPHRRAAQRPFPHRSPPAAATCSSIVGAKPCPRRPPCQGAHSRTPRATSRAEPPGSCPGRHSMADNRQRAGCTMPVPLPSLGAQAGGGSERRFSRDPGPNRSRHPRLARSDQHTFIRRIRQWPIRNPLSPSSR